MTLIDPTLYAAPLDEVDRRIAAGDSRNLSGDFEPGRLLVAALQRMVWYDAGVHQEPPIDSGDSFHILLPIADTLAKRKLKLSPDVAADLAMFAVFPAVKVRYAVRTDYLSPVLKLLESNVPPPASPRMKQALEYLAGRIVDYMEGLRESYARFGATPGTKTLEKALARVYQLMG